MRTHNIGFYEEISKLIIKYHQIHTLFLLLVKYSDASRAVCACSRIIYAAKTKALISCELNVQLICAFGFAYAKSRFSHAAQIMVVVESISRINEI